MRPFSHRLFLLILMLSIPACAPKKAKPVPERVALLAQLPYPDQTPVQGDLDILVERKGGKLKLINRTPRTFENVQIWLNHEYVAVVSAVAIGPNNLYDVKQFVNQHRQMFPVAGFLSPDRAFPVVLTELYDPASSQRYRLTVVKDDSLQILR